MTTIDFLILGFLAYQAIGGFRNGFVKIMLQFIAILLSFKISILAYPELNQFLKIKLHLSHTPSTIVSFILIWIGIFMIIKIIGIILDKLISSGALDKTYPPEGPLELLTKLFFFNCKKICSKKDIDIPCLNEISVRFVGFSILFLAKSANACTAYLPLFDNFILIKPYFIELI